MPTAQQEAEFQCNTRYPGAVGIISKEMQPLPQWLFSAAAINILRLPYYTFLYTPGATSR